MSLHKDMPHKNTRQLRVVLVQNMKTCLFITCSCNVTGWSSVDIWMRKWLYWALPRCERLFCFCCADKTVGICFCEGVYKMFSKNRELILVIIFKPTLYVCVLMWWKYTDKYGNVFVPQTSLTAEYELSFENNLLESNVVTFHASEHSSHKCTFPSNQICFLCCRDISCFTELPNCSCLHTYKAVHSTYLQFRTVP